MKTAVRIRAVSRKNEDHVLVFHVIIENNYLTDDMHMGYRKRKGFTYPFVLTPGMIGDQFHRMIFDNRRGISNWRSRMTTNLFHREIKKGNCFTVWNGAIEYIFEIESVMKLTKGENNACS